MKYTLTIPYPNIFVIKVDNYYDLGMLFCRVSTYYEDTSPEFYRKAFSIWDFMGYYSKSHKNAFTYAADWVGFNIPLYYAKKCMMESLVETPYDKIINELLSNLKNVDGYLIGIKEGDSDTYEHELCHAFYGLNKEYKQTADEWIKTIPSKIYEQLKKNLYEIGYNEAVIDDEIQAYMYCRDWATYAKFRKNITHDTLEHLSNEIYPQLSQYFPK